MEQPPEEVGDGPPGEEPLEDFYGDVVSFGPAQPRLPAPPPKKARTAAGALLTGIALGLRNVFDPEKKNDTIAIEQEAPSEPDGPQRYEVRLNGSPRDARAVYRPWVDPEGDGPTTNR
ncbi:MAG: hypothetical protein M3Y04_03745 [Actinomycetota bacterium]|nr:hypothetical protein [Actinomycetota bacterium]